MIVKIKMKKILIVKNISYQKCWKLIVNFKILIINLNLLLLLIIVVVIIIIL